MKSFCFGFVLMLAIIYGGPYAAKYAWKEYVEPKIQIKYPFGDTK